MLGDDSRRLTGKLAMQQSKDMAHDEWLTEQVNAAFSKLERGQSEFVSNEDARMDMEAGKRTIREIKKGISTADDGRLVDHADLKARWVAKRVAQMD